MSSDQDLSSSLVQQVQEACIAGLPLRVVGGDSKRFHGRQVEGRALSMAGHSGIIIYDPAELVITVRAGTPLQEVQARLAAHGQHLPFEPPAFGATATIGGTIAAGIAGPARMLAGPVRDYVLGARLLTGDGRVLRFGGEVMKNVAGYDVARTLAGSLGVLGVLLDVSLKVLPQPTAQTTRVFAVSESQALQRMTELNANALPVSASAWVDGHWYLRLDGAAGTIEQACARLGGEQLPDAHAFWTDLREQRQAALALPQRLWRLTLPATAGALSVPAAAIEWNGVQRWYHDLEREQALSLAAAAGGFATLFRGARADEDVFAALSQPLLQLHRNLKRIFDPAGILNPGRMYRDL